MGSLPVSAIRFPHQKILENQIPFAAGEWRATTTALDLAINRVRAGFDFDDAIKRVAGRAMERRWLLRSHDTPPTHLLLLVGINLYRRLVEGKYCHAIVTWDDHIFQAEVPNTKLERPRSRFGAFFYCDYEASRLCCLPGFRGFPRTSIRVQRVAADFRAFFHRLHPSNARKIIALPDFKSEGMRRWAGRSAIATCHSLAGATSYLARACLRTSPSTFL